MRCERDEPLAASRQPFGFPRTRRVCPRSRPARAFGELASTSCATTAALSRFVRGAFTIFGPVRFVFVGFR
jgi:hypothetical protein